MSGFIKTLFGGSDSSSKARDMTPPELAGLRGPFADAIKALIGTGGLSGVPSFGGNLTAPITDGEKDVLSSLSIDDPLQSARRELLTRTMRGDFLPGAAGSNPFLQASIEAAQRPTLQGLEETLSRTLPGRFTQAGQFVGPRGSSAFDRAAAIATRGATQEMGDIATQLSFGTQEAERGRQQESIQLGQNEVQTLISTLQAKALPRLIEDMGIERGLDEFKTRLNALLQALGIVTSAPLQNIGNNQKSSTGANVVGTLLSPLNISR